MTVIIDGKAAAASVIEAVTSAATGLETSGHRKPGLAVVIVGNDPASHAYVGAKSRMAKQCGFNSIQHTLPEETSQGDLMALVASLNADPDIDGIVPVSWTPNAGDSRKPPVSPPRISKGAASRRAISTAKASAPSSARSKVRLKVTV